MSDNIVWYAPEIFVAAMIVLVIIGVVVVKKVVTRARHHEPEFECVEEIS